MKEQNPYGESYSESRQEYYGLRFRNKRLESAIDEEHVGKIALALLHPIHRNDVFILSDIALGGYIRKDVQDFLIGWLAENYRLSNI